MPPSDGYLYVENFQLLDVSDFMLMLLTITPYNSRLDSYCKILNVNDGTVSDVVSCDQDVREWSSGDTDPSSTSITSAEDNNDGTVDILLSRNDLTVGITGIPYTQSGESSTLYYDQFTISSIYTTFIFLTPQQYTVEIVRITFNSLSDNTSPTVSNMGTADWPWGEWEVGNTPNMIPVYEDAYALQLPLVCCLCDSQFIARYYFEYDALSGEISGVQMDKQINGGIVDKLGQKAYDWGIAFPTAIDVYDLSNIGGAYSRYTLDLNYTTSSPTTQPTNTPSTSPTYYTSHPSKSPTRTDIDRYTTTGNDVYEDEGDGQGVNSIMDINLGSAVDYVFYYLIAGIVMLFIIICILSWLDSKCCCRGNDYFKISALFVALFQVMDMLSDVFFAINALSYYQKTDSFECLLIFILSASFIIIPVLISLQQLHASSSKYWIYDNRMREWLLSYSRLLFAVWV
eukprot:1087097_1